MLQYSAPCSKNSYVASSWCQGLSRKLWSRVLGLSFHSPTAGGRVTEQLPRSTAAVAPSPWPAQAVRARRPTRPRSSSTPPRCRPPCSRSRCPPSSPARARGPAGAAAPPPSRSRRRRRTACSMTSLSLNSTPRRTLLQVNQARRNRSSAAAFKHSWGPCTCRDDEVHVQKRHQLSDAVAQQIPVERRVVVCQ